MYRLYCSILPLLMACCWVYFGARLRFILPCFGYFFLSREKLWWYICFTKFRPLESYNIVYQGTAWYWSKKYPMYQEPYVKMNCILAFNFCKLWNCFYSYYCFLSIVGSWHGCAYVVFIGWVAWAVIPILKCNFVAWPWWK